MQAKIPGLAILFEQPLLPQRTFLLMADAVKEQGLLNHRRVSALYETYKSHFHQRPLSQKSQTDPAVQKSLCYCLTWAEDGKTPKPQPAWFYDELKVYDALKTKGDFFKALLK